MFFGDDKNKILIFNQFGAIIHNTLDGEITSKYQHKTRYGINAAQPLILGDRILLSSAYGKGAALVDFKRRYPASIWESESFSCQMASLVRLGNHAYGIHGQAGGKSNQSKYGQLIFEIYQNNFETINMVTMSNIKLYYLKLLGNLKPEYWDNIYNTIQKNKKLYHKSNIHIVTSDAKTLTGGPTIFLAENVDKIARFCLQEANIPNEITNNIFKIILIHFIM